jgi:hypothetical protein
VIVIAYAAAIACHAVALWAAIMLGLIISLAKEIHCETHGDGVEFERASDWFLAKFLALLSIALTCAGALIVALMQ